MNFKAIVLIFAGVLMVSANLSANQPSTAATFVDFDLQILEEPRQVGDMLRVSWSFIVNESEDPNLRSLQDGQIPTMYAKAFLVGVNVSDIVGGEAVWRGEIQYGRTYEQISSVEIRAPGKIVIRPVVEIYSEPDNETYSTRLSRDVGDVVTLKIEDNNIDQDITPELTDERIQITTHLVPDRIKRCAELVGDSTLLPVNDLRQKTAIGGFSGGDSKQTWSLSGTFDYEDAFGGTSNPVAQTECVLYWWTNGDPYYQYITTNYTDADGDFQFYPNVDSVSIVIFSYDSMSNVFYADDSCFDFSQNENLYNHYFSVSVANPWHHDTVVPSSYTHIDDLSLAGVFHIQAILRDANDAIGFPDFRAPVYFLDKDECAENSSFGRFTMDGSGIPGIQIRGSYDTLDWDQWDTSVVNHELGHLYRWSKASMPMYSGGVHYFHTPTPASGVNDLYLAFVEAWATFFSCVIVDYPVYIDYAYNISDTNIWANLEQPSPDVPYTSSMPQTSPSDTVPIYEGAHVEGSVALALWDLYDDVDDGDYYSGSDLYGHNTDSNSSENWNGWYDLNYVLVNFDPDPYDSSHENCWSVYEFIHGWRNLVDSIGTTFTDIFEAHAVPVFIPGDATGDGLVNLFDISYLGTYLYNDGPLPVHMSAADVDGNCIVNMLDVTYIIDNLYRLGPDLLVGCYNMYPSD